MLLEHQGQALGTCRLAMDTGKKQHEKHHVQINVCAVEYGWASSDSDYSHHALKQLILQRRLTVSKWHSSEPINMEDSFANPKRRNVQKSCSDEKDASLFKNGGPK